MSDINPYQAPQVEAAARAPALVSTDEERLRQAHLFHETSLHAFASLLALAGVLTTLIAFMAFFATPLFATPPDLVGPNGWITLIALLAAGALTVWLAWGLGQMWPAVKWPMALLGVGTGLWGFPIATPLSAFLLYLLFSQKGAFVLSPEYQPVMAATPEIKRRSVVAGLVFPTLLGLTGFLLVVWPMFRSLL